MMNNSSCLIGQGLMVELTTDQEIPGSTPDELDLKWIKTFFSF